MTTTILKLEHNQYHRDALWVPCGGSSPLGQLEATHLFELPVALPIPQRYIQEDLQYVTFEIWLFSLGRMH